MGIETKSWDEYMIDHFKENWDETVISTPQMARQEIGNIKKYPYLLFDSGMPGKPTPIDLSEKFYEIITPFSITSYTGNDADMLKVRDQIYTLVASMTVTQANAGKCVVIGETKVPNQKTNETLYLCNKISYELFT